MEHWNHSLFELKRGDLVMYCGRLAEVVHPGAPFDPIVLNITDEGGIVHTYRVMSKQDLRMLGGDGECVLDAVYKAAAPPSTRKQRRARIAEQWLADPRVGDTFALPDGERLGVVELTESGGFWTVMAFGLTSNTGGRALSRLHFSSKSDLRNYFSLRTRPIYNASAHATMRPEFINHADVSYNQSSPLWYGEVP